MKKTLKLMVFTIFVLSITVLTLGSCDFDISGILGEYVCVHEWSEWDIVEQGDCKTPGLIQRECLNCGAIDEETTALKEHTEGEWVVDKEATCVDGSKHTECTVCGITISIEKIPAAGEHKYENYNCVVCGLTSEECFEFTYIPESDSYEIKANKNCDLPNEISLPSSYDGKAVTSIGYEAFAYCSSLESVVIGDSITTISDFAFMVCPIENIVIPDSVLSIGNAVFVGNASPTIIVEEGNPNYYSDNNCLIEKSTYTIIGTCKNSIIPENVLHIAFGACAYLNITELIIPDSVITIGDCAFEGCDSLVSVTIPDSVTSIGSYAFAVCSSLESVVIGKSIASINRDVFSYCDNLTNLTVSEDNPYLKSIDNNIYSKDGKTFIYYTVNKNDTSFKIPDGVTTIAEYAFYGCDNLASVVIPDSVTSIGNYAFENCDSLVSVTIPDSVTSIGDYTFFSCSSLVSVTIPDSVTSIGSWAFAACSSLVSVTIPDSVTYIGSDAFYSCSSLTEVYYNGSAAEWNSISIGSYNTPLQNATRYYYSESEPTTEGNFWHWGENGEVVVWE